MCLLRVPLLTWKEDRDCLIIDANNKSHIAFAGAGPSGDFEIFYAENTTGTWSLTQVTNNPATDIKPSLWMNGSGKAHIAWQRNPEGDWDVYHTNNTSGSFMTIPVRVTQDNADEEEPSLVIDPFGNAHIAYQWVVGTEQIYYTHNMSGVFTSVTGNQTHLSTLTTTDNQFPSMDIDAGNRLHLPWR